MFLSLRVMALLFCALPVLRFVFGGVSGDGPRRVLLTAAGLLFALTLAAVVCVTKEIGKKNNAFFRYAEIAMFFLLCVLSVFVSGMYQSGYKFLFIFPIVAYTMEYDMSTGLAIAGGASAFILTLDAACRFGLRASVQFESDAVLCCMFMAVAWILGYYVRLERTHIDSLLRHVNLDGLTGLYNHRYFDEYLHELFERGKRRDSIGLIMMDLDGFKQYNDLFGHQQGDYVLRTVGSLLLENAAPRERVFRYGGDEFAVTLPDTTRESAAETAARYKHAVDEYAFEGQEYLPRKALTISAGISVSGGEEDAPAALVERADLALYRAKFLDRRRVEMYASAFEEFYCLHARGDGLLNSIQPMGTLINVINSKDGYTYNHIERVMLYCEKMADYMRMDSAAKKKLVCAAYLFDLGKINISRELLTTEERLTPAQWEKLRRHSADGAEIVEKDPALRELVPVVRAHHERYDGTGYPQGLRGEKIPFLARILTLADSFDAMMQQRPYRKPLTRAEAVEEIRSHRGTQFDPLLAEAFITAMEQAGRSA